MSQIANKEKWQQMGEDLDMMGKRETLTKIEFGAICNDYKRRIEEDPKNTMSWKDWLDKYCKVVDYKRATAAINFFQNTEQIRKELDNDNIVLGIQNAKQLVANAYPLLQPTVNSEVAKLGDAQFNARIQAQLNEKRQKQILAKAASVDKKKMGQMTEEQQANIMNLIVETTIGEDSQKVQEALEHCNEYLSKSGSPRAKEISEKLGESINLVKDTQDTVETMQDGVGVYLAMKTSKGVSVETYANKAAEMNAKYANETHKAASKRGSRQTSRALTPTPTEASQDNRANLTSLLKPVLKDGHQLEETIQLKADQLQKGASIEYSKGDGLLSSVATTEKKEDMVIQDDDEVDIGVSGAFRNLLNYVAGNRGGRTLCEGCKQKFYANQVKDGLCVNCRNKQ